MHTRKIANDAKNVDMYSLGGGSEKVYVLYTHLNVDNYGRSLKDDLIGPDSRRCCFLC